MGNESMLKKMLKKKKSKLQPSIKKWVKKILTKCSKIWKNNILELERLKKWGN